MGIFDRLKNVFRGGRGKGSHLDRLRYAQQMANQGNIPLAKEALTEILEKQPDCLEALVIMGNILGKSMEFDGAVSAYKKALELSENRWDIYGHLACIYHEMGNV